MQVDTWERGFSYSYDAPLDMRMDTEQELDAAHDRQHVGGAPHRADPARVRRRALRAADRPRASSPRARRRDRARRSALVDVINHAIPARARFAGGHPAKRTFQAIRIAVNDELGQVDEALPLAWRVLRQNGRFAGISFHSGEDRRVKRFLAARAAGLHLPAASSRSACAAGRRRPS